jgi:hypothetical protein
MADSLKGFKPFSVPVKITEAMFLDSREPASPVMGTFKGAVVIPSEDSKKNPQ